MQGKGVKFPCCPATVRATKAALEPLLESLTVFVLVSRKFRNPSTSLEHERRIGGKARRVGKIVFVVRDRVRFKEVTSAGNEHEHASESPSQETYPFASTLPFRGKRRPL